MFHISIFRTIFIKKNCKNIILLLHLNLVFKKETVKVSLH